MNLLQDRHPCATIEDGTVICRRHLLAGVVAAGVVAGSSVRASSKSATYRVGNGEKYLTFGALPPLKPGDIVELLEGTYHELISLRTSGLPGQPIVVRGAGAVRPIVDGIGQACSGVGKTPRAVIQISGSHIHLQNLEIRNGRNLTWNGAGVRVTGAIDTTISRCKITSCDMGIMSDGNDLLTVDSCEIAHNGNRRHFNGYSHNLYLEGNRTRVQYCWIHDSFSGMNFKTRGQYTELFYNWISRSNEGEISIVDGTSTSSPYSNAVLIGNIVISKPDRTGNTAKFIDFGQDMGRERNGTLYLLHNTLVAADERIHFLHVGDPHSAARADANIFFGSPNVMLPGPGAITGKSNWIPEGSSLPGFTASVTSAAPGFVAPAYGNYHLAPSSPCLDVQYSGTYRDAMGVPRGGDLALQYSAPCGFHLLTKAGTFAGALGLDS